MKKMIISLLFCLATVYTIRLTDEGALSGGELFFRVISDSKFEWEYMYIITAEHGLPVMTFEKENNSNN